MSRTRARSRVLTPLLVVLTASHLAVVSVAAGADGADAAGRVFVEGFEGGLERWGGRGIELTQTDRHEGEQCLRVCDDDTRRYEQAEGRHIPLVAGKEYLISVWCRPRQTSSRIRFTAIQTRGGKLLRTPAGGVLFVEHCFDAEHREWQRGTGTFRIAEEADGVLVFLEAAAFGKQNTGEALFDDIVIREYVLPRVPLTDAALESDGDGVPEGWDNEFSSVRVDRSEKLKGASSLLVSQESGRAELKLSVEVEPFVQYELSLWVKVEGDWPEWPATAELVFGTGGGAQRHAAPVCATRDWQRLVLRAWSPPGAHSARVVVARAEGRTKLRLDDLSLRVVSRRPRQASAPPAPGDIAVDGDLSDWPKVARDAQLQIGGVPVNEYPNITDWISFVAPTPSTTDISGLAYILWSAEHLYVAVRVADDELSAGPVGCSDGVRIGLTREPHSWIRRWYRPWIELPIPAAGRGEVLPYRLASETSERARPFPDIKAASRRVSGGYIMEAAIPFATIAGAGRPREGMKLGLEVLLLDRDPGASVKSDRPHAVNWRAPTLAGRACYEAINQWHPEDCGVLTLAAAREPTVSVGTPDPSVVVKPLPARELKPIVERTMLARDGEALVDIVAPGDEAHAGLAAQLQAAIHRRCGARPGVLRPEAVTRETFRKRNLILVGNIVNNAALRPLYANYLTCADAMTLGDTFLMHTVPSPFGGERSAIVLGAGGPASARAAVAAFGGLLSEEASSVLPLLHTGRGGSTISAPSEEAVQQAAESAAQEIAGMLAKQGGRGVTARAGKHGLRYQQSGDPLCAVRFLAACRRFLEYLAKEGHAHGDTDDFIDSTAWWMPVGLDCLEESPLLKAEDRRFLTNLVYSVGHYCGSMCSNWAGTGRPRPVLHNHMSFPLLSSWVAGRYFADHYADRAAESWMWVADVLFGRQSHSAQPQEDAGGYLRHIPEHLIHWALAADKRGYLETGEAAAFAELSMAVTDNLGYEAQFGDAGGPRTDLQAQLLRTIAFATDTPSLAWLADKHKKGVGRYVVEHEHVSPPAITGIRSIPVTQGAYDYLRKFTGVPRALAGIPRARTFHKISLRSGVEAQDQYLLLDGLGRGYHHHEDANSIIRMTDKGMICLLDAHYTNRSPVYHNAVTVVRDGRGALFPLFSEKLVEANLPTTGFVQSLLDDYNGVRWFRNILWLKGEYFLVFDELRTKEPGDYSFQCLWRTLGQATLRNQEMLNRNRDGVLFHVRNADSADQCRLSHDVFGIEVERGRGEVTKLHQIVNRRLVPGQSHTYLNLLYTDAPERVVETDFRRVAPQAALVRRKEELALAGLAQEVVRLGDIEVRAGMFLIAADRVALAGATSLRWCGIVFDTTEPVNMEIDLAAGRGVVHVRSSTQAVTRGVDRLKGNAVQGTMALPPGRHEIALARSTVDSAGRRRSLSEIWRTAGSDAGSRRSVPAPSLNIAKLWAFPAAALGRQEVLSQSVATTLSCDVEPYKASPWIATHPVRLCHVVDGTKDFAIWERDQTPTVTFDFEHPVQVDEVTITSYWSRVADLDLPVQPARFTVTGDKGGTIGTAVQEGELSYKSDLTFRIRTPSVTTRKLMIRCEPRKGAAMMVREITVVGADPAGLAPVSGAMGGEQISGLDVRDATGDQTPEILLGTQRGRLVLLRSDGTALLDKTLPASVNDVAMADLDGDGSTELLTGSEDATARCLDLEGNEKWATSFRFYFRPGHVTVLRPADLDGDGVMEVVVGTYNSMAHALSASGQHRWESQVYHHWTKSLDVADLDGDGTQECVFGSSYAYVHVKRADGRDFWKRSSGGKFYGDVACADLDGDGTLDVLAGSKNQCVVRCDHTGKQRFRFDTGATVNAVAAADLDGDGRPEVLAGSSSFWIYALTGNGELMWKHNLSDEVLQLEVGELDGKPGPEIAVGCADGRVVVLKSPGTSLGHYRTGGPVNLLRLADLDGDGRLEAIAASWDGNVYALRLQAR